MRVVFTSARGACGVTTAMLAVASVWPGSLVLVEADESGGVLAARFGLAPEPGVTTLAAAARHDGAATELDEHVQPLPGTDGRLRVLVGPATPEAAQPLWRTAATRIDGLLAAADLPVLVDVGRLLATPAVAPLIAGADRVVVVARPRADDLQAVAQRLPVLSGLGATPELLLVGDRPYHPQEVAATVPYSMVGELADDRPAAEALAGTVSTRRLGRSLLLRTAAGLVDALQRDPPTPSEKPGAAWTATTRGGDR